VPLDPAFVGHAYPRSEIYEVGRQKIKEFADAIGDDHPMYRDSSAARAAGHADVIAPPTFATILFGKYSLQSLVDDPKLGLNYERLVHGDMSFEYERPVCAGDQLTVITHIAQIDSRMGNDFLNIRAEIDTADGDRVVTAYAQLVIRAEDQ
jgi:acyl dehydratase